MSKETFKQALESLRDWPKPIGVIGGEPLLHPDFREFNRLIREFSKTKKTDSEKCPFKFGLWTSGIKSLPDPHDDADIMNTYGFINFNPHDPEQLKKCRHQPITVAINEVIKDKDLMWNLIDSCWVQRLWSPTITYKGAYFCEVAAAQDILLNDGKHAWPITNDWWKRRPEDAEFRAQKEALCPNCGMPVPMDRELIGKHTEKFTPILLEKFRQARLPYTSAKDIEIYEEYLSPEIINDSIVGWHPANYREDIQKDEETPWFKGYVGDLSLFLKKDNCECDGTAGGKYMGSQSASNINTGSAEHFHETATQKLLIDLAKLRYGNFAPEIAWQMFPLETAVLAMTKSGEFNQAAYLEENPDVKASGMNPIEHYLRFGIFEKRSLMRLETQAD